MQLRRHSLLSLALIALGVVACQTREQPDDEVARVTEITDGLGRALSLALPVGSVLSLAPNLTEIVYAIGASDRLLAASQADTYPPEVGELPQFSSFPPDHERILQLNPDLMLGTVEINSPTDAEALAKVGVPTYFFVFDDVASISAAMRRMGELLGADAEPAARDFEGTVDSVHAATEGFPRPRTLLFVGDDVLYAFGRESYASEAVRIAGGDNLTDAFEGAAAVVSDEFVLRTQPDVVLVLTDEPYSVEKLLAKHASFAVIPAVQTGRVHSIHPDLLSRPGPRLALGIAQVAALLHPVALVTE